MIQKISLILGNAGSFCDGTALESRRVRDRRFVKKRSIGRMERNTKRGGSFTGANRMNNNVQQYSKSKYNSASSILQWNDGMSASRYPSADMGSAPSYNACWQMVDSRQLNPKKIQLGHRRTGSLEHTMMTDFCLTPGNEHNRQYSSNHNHEPNNRNDLLGSAIRAYLDKHSLLNFDLESTESANRNDVITQEKSSHCISNKHADDYSDLDSSSLSSGDDEESHLLSGRIQNYKDVLSDDDGNSSLISGGSLAPKRVVLKFDSPLLTCRQTVGCNFF
jgi:hypothetical protein